MSSLLWTAEELVKHVFPQAFLIEPFVPREGIVFFHGKRNIGKSQLALTIAVCLSEHGALFGKYPTHAIGPVVYIQADMGAAIQQLRLRQIQQLYPLQQLHFFFPRFFNLATITMQDETMATIAKLKPSIVFWDTLRKIQRLGTNDDDVASFIYGKSQDMFPTATHFFVHHDKKTIVDQEQLDPEELFRGSGAWLDDADTGLHLERIASGRLMLTFTKTRTCESQPQLPLLLHPETLLLYATGEQTAKLIEHWKLVLPGGTSAELERYLLSSFVAPPSTIRQLIHGGGNGHRQPASRPGPNDRQDP